MMDKETFCSFPFNTVFLGADGGIKTCCSSEVDLGNINTNTIDEILTNPLARDIRQHIVDGRWHPACAQCKKLESMGARTERTSVLKDYERFEDATADTFVLEKIDLRWSNTCNLACNYCYEYFSSQWASIKGIKVNANKETAEGSIFALIDKHRETIVSINLLGGEPLLQKQNLRLLDVLPEKQYYVLTNLSVDVRNNKIMERLLKNENASIGISFDTVGE